MEMVQILGTVLQFRKTPSCSGDTKKILLVRLGWDKGRFKVLYFTNTNISFTFHSV